jgi:hypothetical protein
VSASPHAASPGDRIGGRAGIDGCFAPTTSADAHSATDDAATSTGLRLAIVAVFSLVAATLAPVWVLLLSPLLFGLPHIAADLRWMVGRTPLGRADLRLVAVAACLVAHITTGHLAFGLAAVPVAALTTPATNPKRPWLRPALGLLGLLLVALALLQPTLTARVFAQAHNAVALLVLVVFTGRARPLLGGLGIVAAVAVAIALGALDGVVASLVTRLPAPGGIDMALLARSLGGTGVAGERYALLFAFGQLVHYGVWLWLLSSLDEARGDASSARDDLGVVWWWIVAAAAIGTVALVLWGAADVLAARQGYFRFALFHGALELAALTVLACEFDPRGRRTVASRPTSTSS